MGKESSSNPIIRILVLGSPGVGKNCLESRFTTSTYPPPYDPTLMLSSRRFFTLCPLLEPDISIGQDPIRRAPVLRHGLPEFTPFSFPLAAPDDHDHTASLPVSTPATTPTSVDTQTTPGEGIPSRPCDECVQSANTYLVEVINYPALQSSKARQRIYAKCEYEAVLLVYDVGDHKSFDKITALHSELPFSRSGKHQSHHRRTSSYPSAPQKSPRRVSFFGKYPSAGMDGEGGATGSAETVVALVGNKVDCDSDRQHADTGSANEGREAAVELVHPVIRENRLLCDDWSLDSRSSINSDDKRSVLSFDQFLDPRRSIASVKRAATTHSGSNGRQKPLKTLLRRAESIGTVEKWLEARQSFKEEVAQVDESSEGETWPHLEPNNAALPLSSRRQVSTLEGEMLSSLLHVPFFETSAKTGENIEEMFSAVVREVLKEMGQQPPTDGLDYRANMELLRRCQHKHGHETPHEERPGLSKIVTSAGKIYSAEDDATGHGLSARSPRTKAIGEEYAVANQVERRKTLPRRQQVERRNSVMEKMRKMFTKKTASASGSNQESTNQK